MQAGNFGQRLTHRSEQFFAAESRQGCRSRQAQDDLAR
jgi:hypothetical protein